MTPIELDRYLELTAAITHHKQALDVAVKEKQDLARTLYERYGRHAVYRIGDAGQQQDLMISRTTVGTYYFAPRVRYPKESRYAKAEQKRLDRAARMQRYPTQASVARPKRSANLPTSTEVEAAIERGQHDRDRATASRAAKLAPSTPVDDDAPKVRLPIVGDVNRPPAPPEPRLLEIQEPSGVLLGDTSKPRT